MNFHESIMGQRFFQKQLPDLTNALNRVAEATEKANEIAASKTENSEPVAVCYGFNKFKNILADNVTLKGITEFVQNNDGEIISQELYDAFRELLASEGCCPDCNMALLYNDYEDHDFVCSGCGKLINLNEVAPFIKTKLPEEASEDKKACSPYELCNLGDDVYFNVPSEPVDCSHMNFFDEIEYDCFELIKKYASLFKIKLYNSNGEPIEKDDISFDLAKDVQECVLNMFVRAGIKFKFTND